MNRRSLRLGAAAIATAALMLGGVAPAHSTQTAPASLGAADAKPPKLRVSKSYTPAGNRVTEHQLTIVGAKKGSYRVGLPSVKVTKNKGVKRVSQPGFTAPNYDITPAHKHRFYFMNLSPGNTPGKYRLTFPITRTDVDPAVSNKVSVNVVIKANKKESRARTWLLKGTVKRNGSGTFQLRAPDYQRGAKVTMYYKAKGKSKYKKVATGKLDRNAPNGSKAKLSVKSKHDLKAGGRIYFKIGSVKYAGSYKTTKTRL